MSTALGSVDIYTRLINDTNVTTLLDTDGSDPLIYNDRVLPVKMAGNKAINIYQTGNMSGGLEYIDINFTVNCWGGSLATTSGGYTNAITIQNAVFTSLNRLNKNGYFFVCDIFPPIPPQDKSENYNAPIGVRVRKT